MYPSGVGTTFHDPLTTNFRKSQSLGFHSGRPLLKDYKQESGHIHPLLSGTEGANVRQGKGLQYTNGVVSFDGNSRAQTAQTQHSGATPRSLQGQMFPTSVGTPAGNRRSHEGFAGASWDSRPNTAYPSYGRRYVDLMQRSRPNTGLPNNPPRWLSLDKQMLSFEAFFKESVDESRQESYRVRRCVLQYFLEDDSIKITEPKEENSGIPQGAFLKRHRIPKPDGTFYTWRDLDLQGEMTFYGRTFRLVDCDQRTRDFYALKGFQLSPPEVIPEDPVRSRSRPSTAQVAREVLRDADGRRMVDDYKGYMEARLGKCQDDKEVIVQFLANDRKVLRFFCHWDDRGAGGDAERREFRLHYFLADDTVEVLEVNKPNSGRDPWPALLKRMKLPKVWSSNSRDNRNFYRAQDFKLGDTVSVFGRKLLLHDCDDFTRQYYQQQFGQEMEPIPVSGPRKHDVIMPIPPHNGIGREEDSIMNVMSLHPKPPKMNVMRRLQNKSKMLRFVAKLEKAVGFDKERVFTVNYHLDTDDISIFEPQVRNSGRVSGKFMDKQKIKKPGSSEYYCEQDLHVGAKLHCFGRTFELLDADVYTVNYMAQHPELFPHANPDAIKEKVARFGADLLDTLEQRFRAQDVMGTGCVVPEDFRETLHRACPALNTQEIMTLQHSFETSEGGNVSYAEMIQCLATWDTGAEMLRMSGPDDTTVEGAIISLRRQLQRRGPSGVRGLGRSFAHVDHEGDRLVGRMTLRETLMRAGLTLSDEGHSELFRGLELEGRNVVDYASLLDAVCGELPGVREQAARRAFSAIDRNNAGSVRLDDIMTRFDAARHPAVLSKEMTADEARAELADCFEGAGSRSGGMIGLPEFLRIYSEISVAFEDDGAFCEYMANVWDIPLVLKGRRSWR